MVNIPAAKPNAGANLQTLGLRSPTEVFDILALLKVDGEPIISDDRVFLDPKAKTRAVIDYFQQNFNVSAQDLPHLASAIKHDLKNGKINWRG